MSYDTEVQADQPMVYLKMSQTTGGTPGSVTETNFASANGWTGAVAVNGTYDTGYYTGTTKLTVTPTNGANVGWLLNRASLVATQPSDKSVLMTNNGLSPTQFWNSNARQGAGTIMTLADNAAWDTASLSVEFWIKSVSDIASVYNNYNTLHLNQQTIINRRTTGTTLSWTIVMNSNGTIQFNQWGQQQGSTGGYYAVVAATGGASNYYLAANSNTQTFVDTVNYPAAATNNPEMYQQRPLHAVNLLDGNTHHVVCVHDSVARTLRIYVDGILRTATLTYSSSFTPVTTTADPITIGAFNTTAGAAATAFIGYIGHVSIYNTALSGARIAAHYYAGAGFSGGLDLAWLATGVKQESISDSFATSESNQIIDSAVLGDTLSITPTIVDLVPTSLVVIDGITFSTLTAGGSSFEDVIANAFAVSEAVVNLRQSIGELSDTLTMSEAQEFAQLLNGAINDGFIIGIGTIISGENYTGWVMNANTDAVSRYVQYPFNSFADLGTTQLGAMDDGIYELGGDTDEGVDINAAVLTGRDDFDESVMKRMLKAYLGLATNGQMYLTTITNENERRTYLLDVNNTSVREAKIDLGRGVKSRYWQFEITNVAGSDFEIEAVEWYPVLLTRRV